MHEQDERRGRPRFAAVLALAAAGAFGTATLSLAAEGKAPSRAPINQVRASEAGLRVYIDPATGKIKEPTEAEKQALEKALAPLFGKALKKFTATQFADGTVSIDLSGQFLDVTIVTTNADGTLSASCVNGLDDAMAALVGAPALEEK